MDRLDRRLIQLKMERLALEKEDDDASRKRLAALDEEIARLSREYADLEEIWRAEKAAVGGAQSIKEELDRSTRNSRPPAGPATWSARRRSSTAASRN